MYRSYASPIYTVVDYIRLMKDCRMVSDKRLSRKEVEAIWPDGAAIRQPNRWGGFP